VAVLQALSRVCRLWGEGDTIEEKVCGHETWTWNKGKKDEQVILDRDIVVVDDGIEWVKANTTDKNFEGPDEWYAWIDGEWIVQKRDAKASSSGSGSSKT
jgi:hypothetical protein